MYLQLMQKLGRIDLAALHELSPDFADLGPFSGKWALATEAERNAMRRTTSMRELTAFYDAMLPRMRDIIAHLNMSPLDHLSTPDRLLLNMALSFMEVAMAVEVFKEPDETGAFPADRYHIEESGLQS